MRTKRLGQALGFGVLAFGLALTVSACGSSRSGGGASSSASSSGGASSNTGASFTGTDATPPTLTADVATGPGAMITGANPVLIKGTITDAESGPAQVTVNGQPATLVGNDWQAFVTLPYGTAYIEVVGRDVAGNEARFGYSVIYAEQLLDPTQPIAEAAMARLARAGFADLSRAASRALANTSQLASSQIGKQVQFTLFNQPYTATLKRIRFGAPTIDLSPSANGLVSRLEVPNPFVEIDVPGLARGVQVQANRAEVDLTLRVDVAAGGGYRASVSGVQVQLVRPRSNHPLISLAIQLQVIETALEDMIRNQVPNAVVTALQQVIQPVSFSALGTRFSVDAEPSAVHYSADAFEVVLDANITSPQTGTSINPAGASGSFSRRAAIGSALPVVTQETHDLYAWVNEEAINRALFAFWESRVLDLTIDQQFLNQLGLPQLPINVLDGRVVALFFPQLSALLPPSGPVPMAIRIRPGLSPTLLLAPGTQGASLQAAFGEFRLSIAMDLGSGYTDVLALDLFAQADAQLAIRNGNALVLTLGQQLQFHYRIGQNPFGFNPPDVSTFINNVLPQLTNLLNALLPPLPIPALPSFLGVQPSNLDLRIDGAGGDFLNLRADL